MASKDLVFRFLGVDGGAGREFDRMAGKSATLEKAIGGLGVAMAGAAVAIGVESVRAAAKFQQSMELIHTQAGRSQATVDAMSKSVLAMAGSVATAPDELAKGLYHLASTGMSAARTMAALKIAAEGAKLGGADLESVTNALNATLASGIKGAQNMSQAMGALNAVVGSGDMRMQDLSEAMGTGFLAAVKGFGVNLNDVGAALATFGDNNIRGADAATQLRMAVLFMAKPAATAGDALKSLGMTSHTLADDMRERGLGGALEDLHKRLIKAGDTGAKMGQVLLDMFGHKAGTGISILEQQYSRFQSKQEEVHRGSRNFASDWTSYTQTFGYSWDRAKTSFESMTIQISTKLLPTATKAMNWIGTTGVQDVSKFGNWISDNKKPIEDVAKALAAIAAFRLATGTLSKINGLFGGGKAGGGLLGGGSKLTPVHVWVDNPNFGGRGGGPGGGGGGVSGAERAGEGMAAERAGSRLATRFGLKGIGRLGGPLYATYLATQGGDQNPAMRDAVTGGNASQALSNLIRSIVVRPGFDLAKASGAEKSAYAAAYHGGGGQTGVNIPAAVSFINQFGTPQQIAAVQKLAGAITGTGKDARSAAQIAAAAANREGDAWGGAARNMGAAHVKAVNLAITQLRRIPGAMRGLAADAKAAGTDIGAMLDAGLTVGIQQNSGRVNIVTKQVVDGVVHTATKAAALGSPSKKTTYIGKMLAAGLELGLRSGKKGVGQATSQLMDSVYGNITGQASLSGLGSMTDTLGASGGGKSIGDILAFLGGQASGDRALSRNLALARKHGLTKSMAAQVAMLGPDAGPIAASLAHATRSQIRQVNADNAAINRYAHQIAGTVSLSDSTIAKLGRAIQPHVHVTTPAQLDRHSGKKIVARS